MVDLELLELCVSRNRLNELKESLHFPGRWSKLWPDDWPQRLASLVARLRRSPESEGLGEFLELNLLASFLTRPECLPENCSAHLARPELVSRLVPGAGDPDRIAAGRWISFPVLLAVSGRARVRHFAAGMLPREGGGCGRPAWAEEVMDADAREALAAAAAHPSLRSVLPEGLGFYLFPLVVPAKTLQITGRSLGLPACLAFHCLARSELWPERVAATGEIGADEALRGVGHLAEKAAAAGARGFKALLYPEGNGSLPGGGEIEAIPVRTVDEAHFLSRMYAPGRGRELMLLGEMLSNPDLFVGNMERFDPAWVRRADDRRMMAPVAEAVFRSPALIEGFVSTLARLAAEWKLGAASALAGIVDDASFRHAARATPLWAFRFCTVRTAIANHLGDVATAVRWVEEGGRLYKTALKADIDACADFLNNRFVTQHNHYRFDPVLSDEVREMLARLEGRRQLQCEIGCEVDRKLGELHGTIAQNFGFCGPRYLELAFAHSAKSIDAFGRGEVPERFEDFLRQYGYMVYAFLDAGQTERALKTFGAFTGTRDWQEVLLKARSGKFSRWQHAALARLLAHSDHGGVSDLYLGEFRDFQKAGLEEKHPWQLWAWNMGVLAVHKRLPSTALKMFTESLRLCRKFGPTVRVMALLPLSGLRLMEALPADLPAVEIEVREAAEMLNPDHFQAVLENRFERVLEAVWWKPEVFFPFTYR